MSFSYGHIAQRVFNTPLAVDERKAQSFLIGLGGRIAGNNIVVMNGGEAFSHTAFANGRPFSGRLGDGLKRAYQRVDRLPFDMDGSCAFIPVEGTLVHKGSYVGQSSGVTSYEGLRAQFAIAAESSSVRGAVVEFDSFGGECSGMFEACKLLAQLSKVKPTIAVLTDFAFSAGYALASQCREIIAPNFGGAGSVGVIMLHADYSKWLEQEGIAVSIIKAGEKKGNGNPYEPLDPDTRGKWEAQAEDIRDSFAEIVGKARRGRTTKAKVLATEAEAFDAKEALSLGLIDAVGDTDDAVDAFVNAINKG